LPEEISDLSDLRRVVGEVHSELDKPLPEPAVVAESYEKAISLQDRIEAWLERKADLATDEFAKEIGKEGAKAVGWGVRAALASAMFFLVGWLHAVGYFF
jgi:hypothetical protein